MDKLLIATTNQAKLAEFKKYFSSILPPIKLLSLPDLKIVTTSSRSVLGITPRGCAVENGKTFEENAIIKARFYAKKTGLLTLADDGGLEIEALNGEPGVLSRRWPGHQAGDEELVKMVIEKLKGVSMKKRQAQLRTVVVVVNPKGEVIVKEEGVIKGVIPEKPASWIEKDFPFRAVLYLPQFKKFYQDLTEKEHNIVNHRKKVILKIANKLKKEFKIS